MFSLCYSITLILTGVNRCRLKLTEIMEMNFTGSITGGVFAGGISGKPDSAGKHAASQIPYILLNGSL